MIELINGSVEPQALLWCATQKKAARANRSLPRVRPPPPALHRIWFSPSLGVFGFWHTTHQVLITFE